MKKGLEEKHQQWYSYVVVKQLNFYLHKGQIA